MSDDDAVNAALQALTHLLLDPRADRSAIAEAAWMVRQAERRARRQRHVGKSRTEGEIDARG